MRTKTFFLSLLSLLSLSTAYNPNFYDATIDAGFDLTPGRFDKRKLLKYGGPTVVDLDRDGYYDLIFVHHGSAPFQVYFNKGDGTFTEGFFGEEYQDNHGTTPFLLPHSSECFFALVPGGFAGNRPFPPVIYRVLPSRKLVDISSKSGLDFFTARGRSGMFLPLRPNKKNPDALFLNAAASKKYCPGCTDGQFDAYRYDEESRRYHPHILKGFNPSYKTHQAIAIDTNGDGKMEIMSWKNLTVHEIVGYFQARDITREVLGENAYLHGVAAIAEIDYDNDGDFDLYIARDVRGFRNSSKGIFPDMLLENRNGKYVNVALEAGVPQNTVSRGVTVGDFNNDGLMDIYVSVLQFQPDFMLVNNGDKTFTRVEIGIGKQGAYGDNAVAVDYDNDGRLDLVRSEGDWADMELGGQFRLLRNVANEANIGGWLRVKVGWNGNQTSQHAVVEVSAGGRKTMQRVGDNGVTLAHSYLDMLHFGIGGAGIAKVKVTWLDGAVGEREVKKGETAVFGSLRK